LVYPTGRHYAQDGFYSQHGGHFRFDPAFRAAYDRGVQASNGTDPRFEWRVHIALWAARGALAAPGDFVECGVNAGFISSAIMHYLHWNETGRKFYLVDTFSGPPLDQYSEQEVSAGRREIAASAVAAGAYVSDMDRIRHNYAEWPDATLVPGVVPDVLERVDARQVAFLHLDMNCAYPEQAALKFFWPRLSAGAAVLFDDYVYFDCSAQTEAIDAAVRQLGGTVLSLPTGQGLLIR
jgi:hypothetical protein